jgi:hypothetical protein
MIPGRERSQVLLAGLPDTVIGFVFMKGVSA